MSRTFAALAERNYRWFLTGQIVTNVGTWMQRVAQDWLVLDLSGGNAVTLGIVTALQFLPFLVVAPFAGVLADRVPRRVVMLIAGIMATLAAGSLGLAVMTGSASVGLVYILAFVLGVSAALDNPARQALLGQLVGRELLSNAVGLNSATFNLSRIIGPALAGLTIAAVGVGPVFVINALSYVFALGTLVMLRPRTAEGRSGPLAGRATMRQGLGYLRTRRDLVIVLVLVFFAGTFVFNYQITTVMMARLEFGVGAAAYGVLGSVLSIGSILGSLLAARRTTPRLRFVLGAGLAAALVTATAGLMPTYLSFLFFLPLCGLTLLTFSVSAQSYLQMGSDGRFRGRVMGFYTLAFFGGTPVGAPILGWVASTFGPRWGLIGGGLLAGVFLVGVAVIAQRRIRARAARDQLTDTTLEIGSSTVVDEGFETARVR